MSSHLSKYCNASMLYHALLMCKETTLTDIYNCQAYSIDGTY